MNGDGLGGGDDEVWDDSYDPVTIFIDVNGDGENNDGFSTTTGAGGYWEIGGLNLSDDVIGKDILEIAPDGSVETTGVVNTVENPGSGGEDSGNDFANFRYFSIEGTKFTDLQGDGTYTDGVSGWEITLWKDSDGNASTLDTDVGGDTAVTTITTDANGDYLFEDLGPGVYWVTEATPEGWEAVGATQLGPITATSGGTSSDNDFTNFQDFKISGYKYEDMNGDGLGGGDDEVWDDSYDPVTIFIDVNGDGENNDGFSTTTGAGGYWEIGGLNLSDDVIGKDILEIAPDGSVETTGVVNTVENPGSGGEDSGNDFANFRLASIEGYKFFDVNRDGTWDFDDANGNGTWDAGEEGDSKEVGAIGWTIELYQEKDDIDGLTGGDGPAIKTTVSDADGFWSFDGLEMGTYYVKEVLKSGWLQTTPDLEGDGVFKVVVDESGEVVIEAVSADPTTYDPLPNDGMLWFGNDMIEGPGVRTPGFWQSDLGQTYWDGFDNNDGVIPGTGNTEEKEGDEFAENDLFELNYPDYFDGVTNPDDPQNPGDIVFTPPEGDDGAYPTHQGSPLLLVGDWNFNTEDDDSDVYDGQTDDDYMLTYQLDDAVLALQGGETSRGKNKDMSKVSTVERSLVASWLNYMAGNSVDTEVEGESIGYWIDQAILYVNYFDGGAADKKEGKEGWSIGVDLDGDGDIDEAGSDIQNVLDGWNNYGVFAGEQITFDADDGTDITSQAYYDAIA